MATNKSLKNQLAVKKEEDSASSPASMLKVMLESLEVKKRYEEALKGEAQLFINSILDLVRSDINLQSCDPESIITSSMSAAALKLSMDKNLGYTFLVPNKDKAVFQLGYKGYLQLALRTALYKSINVVQVHEGELLDWNPLTEALKIDVGGKKSEAVLGYAGYFELLNGFKKTVYLPKERVEVCKNQDEDSALKMVIRDMLSNWGIMSPDMQQAYSMDLNAELLC